MLATRQPVLRRFWYPVLPTSSLVTGPQPFTLLGQRLVIWPKGDGQYAALEIAAPIAPRRSARAGSTKGQSSARIMAGHTTRRASACESRSGPVRGRRSSRW
jgi:hypothetical protein